MLLESPFYPWRIRELREGLDKSALPDAGGGMYLYLQNNAVERIIDLFGFACACI
jgi:hypothetical protein